MGARRLKRLFDLFRTGVFCASVVAFVACGDDSSASADTDDDSSSSKVEDSSPSKSKKSSSSKTDSSSSSSKSDIPLSSFKPAYDSSKVKKGTFVDKRDGQEYRTITIDGQTWMAQNLNYAPASSLGCHKGDNKDCSKYGRIYTWGEVIDSTKSFCGFNIICDNPLQGICPDGWRLMTAADFEFIVKSNGNTHGVEGTRSTFGFGGYNTTGFSLVGAGARNVEGNFEQLNKAAYWFYLTEYSDVQVMSSWTSTNNNKIPESHLDKKHGVSVRCVMVE